MNRSIAVIISTVVIAVAIVLYLFLNPSTSITAVYVDPETVGKPVGQDLSVNVSISDATNLYGWEFKLSWDFSVLDLVNITEGAFLKEIGSTFFTYRLNETAGFVLVDCTLIGTSSGVNGSGVLASIQFHVKNAGTCDLNLYDTKLVDPSEQLMAHTAKIGHFSTP